VQRGPQVSEGGGRAAAPDEGTLLTFVARRALATSFPVASRPCAETHPRLSRAVGGAARARRRAVVALPFTSSRSAGSPY